MVHLDNVLVWIDSIRPPISNSSSPLSKLLWTVQALQLLVVSPSFSCFAVFLVVWSGSSIYIYIYIGSNAPTSAERVKGDAVRLYILNLSHGKLAVLFFFSSTNATLWSRPLTNEFPPPSIRWSALVIRLWIHPPYSHSSGNILWFPLIYTCMTRIILSSFRVCNPVTTRYARYCKRSKDELISDVLLLSPRHGPTHTHQHWSTGKDLHALALCRHWLRSIGSAKRMIGTDSERKPWDTVLSAQLFHICIYIYIERERLTDRMAETEIQN